MTTKAPPTTAEELLNMPDDGFRYELIRGELRKMPPAGYVYGEYLSPTTESLRAHAKANGLGRTYAAETGFKLASAPDHVRAPDAAFVCSERAAAAQEASGFFPGAPDVAVEVVSPRDIYTDVEEKVADWLDAGTLAVIVVDPRRRTVKVHRSPADAVVLTADDTLTVEDAVPGWKLPVSDIFE